MPSNADWLHEITKWKLEAADEDSARYFFAVRGTTSLQTGENHYVLGRKGSGKTAVAEHIRGFSSRKTYVSTLSFKDFPFNELYKLADNSYTRPSQYTTIWKFIVYSAICTMMVKNTRIDTIVRDQISKHIDVDIEHALAKSLLKLTDGGAGFTILGVGANATAKSTISTNDTSLNARTDALENFILRNIDDSSYYILFDELDEDYKDVLDVDVSSSYFDLLIGLFKAAQAVKRALGKKHNVMPIIFLREDIYDLMRDNDKNKWKDSSLTLNWTDGELRKLVAFRLSRALDPASPEIPFDNLFQRLFTDSETRAGGRSSKRHVFQYISARTLMRPRDFISYLRECAKLAIDEETPKITFEQLVEANRGYSLRLREEFVDEIQGAIPYINDVFEILSGMRKQIFTFREFEQLYNEYIEDMPKDRSIDFNTICRVMFHYSAIGNQASQRTNLIFRFRYPESKLNFSESGVIHPGLLRSLQIK